MTPAEIAELLLAFAIRHLAEIEHDAGVRIGLTEALELKAYLVAVCSGPGGKFNGGGKKRRGEVS